MQDILRNLKETKHSQILRLGDKSYRCNIRGSQWGGVFYDYRLKFWLFYGYRLIFFQLRLKRVKNQFPLF